MRRALLIVLGLLAAPLLMVLTAGPAHACSCVGTPFAEQVAGADAVFAGTVTALDDPAGDDPMVSSTRQITWTFAVDTVHRGDVGARASVVAAASEASCGLHLAVGVRYVVVGTARADGRVASGLCAGTVRYAVLPAADLAALGPGRAGPSPAPAPERRPEPVAAPEPGPGPTGPIVAGAALVLVLAALGVVAVRRRRR